MITSYDIYCAYNKAKGKKCLPEDKYRNRMAEKTLINIDKCAQYFNTIYSNIDPDVYMQCGCKLWKTFGPSKFLDERIIEEYKNQDKRIKRTVRTSGERIRNSFKHIGMPLDEYCAFIDTSTRRYRIISDYIKNKVDSVIIVYCLYNRLLRFNDLEREYLYNILNNYDEWVSLMYKYEDLIEQLNEEYREKNE